jgi:hypothetical protein
VVCCLDISSQIERAGDQRRGLFFLERVGRRSEEDAVDLVTLSSSFHATDFSGAPSRVGRPEGAERGRRVGGIYAPVESIPIMRTYSEGGFTPS